MIPADTSATAEPASLTGGDLPEKAAHLYQAMRQMLYASPEVREVLALSWLPDVQRWLYMVRTPSAWTYPKYVIGTTDANNTDPAFLFRCGTPRTAWTEWEELNYGDHT